MPLPAAIERHARRRAGAPAFRIDGQVLTYGGLAGAALHIRRQFEGLPRGGSLVGAPHRLVTIETGNNLLFPAAFLAATTAGNCAALVDPSLPAATRRKLHDALKPDVILRAVGDRLDVDPAPAGTQPEASPPGLPEGRDGDPFLIVFTSGTTGEPKAIVRDRRSWRISLSSGARLFAIDETTHTFAPGPLAHGLALYAMTESLQAGATFTAASHFDAAQAIRTIRDHAIRRLVLVPTMLRRIAERAGNEPLPGISAITVAGAKLTAADHALARRVFPEAALREYYGASELGFVTVTEPGNEASPTAVGRPFPSVRLFIRSEDGTDLPTGETGIIHVDSPLVSDGYLTGADGAGFRKSGGTSTVGDLGYLDAAGILHLLGRSGGMIISGGNNIYPSEVEAALTSLSFIRAAHVFGMAHDDLGAELVAVVEPREAGVDRDRILAGLEVILPRYKRPRRFWLCRTLPMTGSGKIAAGTVRAWLAEGSNAVAELA